MATLPKITDWVAKRSGNGQTIVGTDEKGKNVVITGVTSICADRHGPIAHHPERRYRLK
jgi:hypothetical protein